MADVDRRPNRSLILVAHTREVLGMEPPPPNQTHAHTRMHQLVVYETACALAESETLVEAAPRMLQAICGALGWDYGAFWTVDSAAARLRWAATWHASSLPFDEFAAAS